MIEQKIHIYNGNLLTPGGIIRDGSLLIEAGKIAGITEKRIEAIDAIDIDAKGRYVSPGFIDIHVHGGGGSDFMDATENAFLEIANTHARYGTTAMWPTTLSSSKEAIINTLEVYEAAHHNNKMGAQFLGMHLEGPYFAMAQRGAQHPKYVRNPDPKEYQEILSRFSCISRWSAAPELEGAMEFGRYVQSKGVLPAIAHTDAVYEEVIKAYHQGFTLATHLYSGMSGVTRRNAYRYAGVVESAFIIDGMDVEIIADGAHLPAPLLQLIVKIKGPDRIALITDAIRAAGTNATETTLGSKEEELRAIVEDGVAKLPDRSSFAGSVATADRLIRTMITMANVSLPDAVKMMTATPARIANVDNYKGELVVGKDADIVLFDEDIAISTTIINGRIVYQL
jgi:N-acetylglucosamine-6-phosphate deacetylase